MNRFLTPADKWRLWIVAVYMLVFSIAWPLTPIAVEWASFFVPYVLMGATAMTGLAYRGLKRDEGIAAACFVMAQLLLFCNFAELNNYLALELGRPPIDEFLAGIDRAAGLDWWSYVTWVKSGAVLGQVLTFAYESSLWQLVAAILFLGFTRRFERLDRLSLAFMLSGSIVIAVWAMFPNYGALALRYAQGFPEPAFYLTVSKKEAMELLALYSGTVPPLRFHDITGLIGCPSFHAVMAVLTVRALWGIPLAGVAALAGNILVLLSIPADGGHHFVDVAGGILVAFLSAVFANAIVRRTTVEQHLKLASRGALKLARQAPRFHKV
jgi:membrane-associated phospholipid phosphatase